MLDVGLMLVKLFKFEVDGWQIHPLLLSWCAAATNSIHKEGLCAISLQNKLNPLQTNKEPSTLKQHDLFVQHWYYGRVDEVGPGHLCW